MAKKLKKLLPPQLSNEQLETVVQCSAARLADEQIAAILDCSLQEFVDRKESDLFLRNAYIRGRAEMIKNCAAIVISAAQGTKIGNPPLPVTQEQLDAARFYLEKHAEHWMKD